MVEEYLDQYIYSMELFTSQNDAVDWLEDREGESTLVIMPRLVTDILREKLFSSNTPIVFSSATLSVGETFTYLADGLGIQDYLSFSVESPFDYDEVMEVFATDVEAGGKAKRALELIRRWRANTDSLQVRTSDESIQRASSCRVARPYRF